MRSQAEVLSSQDRPVEGRLNKLESRLDVKMSKLISLRGILSRGARNRLGEAEARRRSGEEADHVLREGALGRR